MGQGEPPAVYLLWCPKCGRVRWEPKPSHAEECDGTPMRVLYEPVRQQPLRGQHEDWRYAAQAELLDVFRKYGLSVATGITAKGLMIGSQDERVETCNLGRIEAYDEAPSRGQSGD